MAWIDATTGFLASTIPIGHNAVKSILFRIAEFLMGFFILKVCALAAAHARQFTSYLMFAEDHIQRWLFVSSRGLSAASLLVLLFTLLSAAASLYGTLLWGLDAPGYVSRATHATLAEHPGARKPDVPYIVQLYFDPRISTMPRAPSLSPSVTVEHLMPTRTLEYGPRIWLDEEGFSVSCDGSAPIPAATSVPGTDEKFPVLCMTFSNGVGQWNCSFHHAFATNMLNHIQGLPEVHFDFGSSLWDSRYVYPNRVDNVWATYGIGAGTTAMFQVFTVTKGRRRHTFVETFFRITMTNYPGVNFTVHEVEDLIRRAAGPDEKAQQDPSLTLIIHDILSAQARNQSYTSGLALSSGPHTVLQYSWSYFTAITPTFPRPIFSLIHMTATNITLLRSESPENPPQPLVPTCSEPWHDSAFAGRLQQTSCNAGASTATLANLPAKFYGTLDTAAVAILHGLGAARSNLSAVSMDQAVMDFVWRATPRMVDLLTARVLLVGLAGWLAVVAWAGMEGGWTTTGGRGKVKVGGEWPRSLLASLVGMTVYRGAEEARKGYMGKVPEVEVVASGEGVKCLVVDGRVVWLWEGQGGDDGLESTGTQGQDGLYEPNGGEEKDGVVVGATTPEYQRLVQGDQEPHPSPAGQNSPWTGHGVSPVTG
ncbi:hypothetical protein VTJ49DRAFT_4279 [Mycothermus thermophilus]|uniref:Uncharacterized protein n=1 Tax=Humicola insolens TaxID=85995 RepID=A0ABR3V6M6_HUMIN